MTARYPARSWSAWSAHGTTASSSTRRAFRHEIDHAVAAGFRHVYVFGTAGEGYAVDTRGSAG